MHKNRPKDTSASLGLAIYLCLCNKVRGIAISNRRFPFSGLKQIIEVVNVPDSHGVRNFHHRKRRCFEDDYNVPVKLDQR